MEAILRGPEVECVKKLAKLYEAGTPVFQREGADDDPDNPEDWSVIGCTQENYNQILGMMERIGAITDVGHVSGVRYWHFTIDPRAVLVARTAEAQEERSREAKDILESLKLTLRKHPVAGWLIAVSAAVVLLATAITQIHGALKVLGLVEQPPPTQQK